MEKTNFEKLRVYRLAEALADSIWKIVLQWDYLAKDTVGKQIVRAADSIGANIAEGSGEEHFRTIEDSSEWRAGPCTKRSIGFDDLIRGRCSPKKQVETLRCTIEELTLL